MAMVIVVLVVWCIGAGGVGGVRCLFPAVGTLLLSGDGRFGRRY